MTAPGGENRRSEDGSLRRTLGNTAWLTVSSAATRALAYVQFLLAVRAFSDAEVGIYAICLTCLLFAELLANLGLDRVLVREIARLGYGDARELFDNALLLKSTAALVAYGLCLVGFRCIYADIFASHRMAVVCFLTYVPICAVARSFESHFTAVERMAIPALGQLAERLVLLAAAVSAWLGWIGFDSFLAVFPLAALARAACPGLLFLGEREQRPLTLSRQKTLGLLSEASWMFAVEIVAVAYFRVDIFMLSKMVDLRSTGLYLTAYKIFDFFIAMFSGYLIAIFPAMSRKANRIRPSMLALGSGAVFLCFSLPVILLRQGILRLFKPEYVEAAPVLVCLMLVLPLVYANSMLANFAVATAKVRTLFLLALPMLAINIGLNMGLVPVFGIFGSAVATLASEILLGLALILALQPFRRKAPAEPEALGEVS